MMNRFNDLFNKFEKHILPAVKATPVTKLIMEALVFSYKDGKYSVYEKRSLFDPIDTVVEINPAKALTSDKEIWFFYDRQGLQAHIAYAPDYRPEIYISCEKNKDRMPYLEIRVSSRDKPAISGFETSYDNVA